MNYSIKNELETQDNRATSCPMFCVQALNEENDSWYHLDVFFTQKGADEYVENVQYDYDHLRIYVATGCRNPEWQLALKLLKDENF